MDANPWRAPLSETEKARRRDLLFRIGKYVPFEAEPAAQVVVSDDGAGTRLTLYSEANSADATTLTPIRAIGLATRLLDVAASHLPLRIG